MSSQGACSELQSLLGETNHRQPEINDNLTEEQQKKIDTKCKKELGFTRVIEILSSAKKPIIGHNMLFDVAFIYEQFVAPLPGSYTEFATLWKNHFPLVYDTKTLAISSGEFQKTALSHLFYRC